MEIVFALIFRDGVLSTTNIFLVILPDLLLTLFSQEEKMFLDTFSMAMATVALLTS